MNLVCPDCGGSMELAGFRGRLRYECTMTGCKGVHGAHRNGKPLGTPADEKTRRARSAAHCAFDRIWEAKRMSRGEAYSWLSKVMNVQEAHIGNFNSEQCKAVVAEVKKHFPELFPFSDDVP